MKRILVLGFVLMLSPVSLGQVNSGILAVAQAEEDLTLGKNVYRANCEACHGEKGDGNGPQADRLKTKPRDFTKGIYKFRSTPSGSLPLDQDMYRTVSGGVRATSMLPQLQLSERELISGCSCRRKPRRNLLLSGRVFA
jgi:cytochrome c oxidase cbb3-type subunit 2